MPAATENILVRSVNWLGDAVMSTPALMRLRQARPGARITLLSPEKLAGLWEGQPFVDEVLTFAGSATVWQVGWRLRADGGRISIEDSIYLGGPEPRRSEQVVITGSPDGPQQVKWAISKVG